MDRDLAAAEATAAHGSTMSAVGLDVLDGDAVQRVAAELGAVDVLVFTAATNVRKRVLDYTAEEFDRVVSLNLRASFDLIRAFGAGMAERGRRQHHRLQLDPGHHGRARARASTRRPRPGWCSCSAPPRPSSAPRGCGCNAIAPGIVDTPLTAQIRDGPASGAQAYADKSALGRWSQPDELAGAVVYLASDASSFVTGSSCIVDGGWTAIDGRYTPPT